MPHVMDLQKSVRIVKLVKSTLSSPSESASLRKSIQSSPFAAACPDGCTISAPRFSSRPLTFVGTPIQLIATLKKFKKLKISAEEILQVLVAYIQNPFQTQPQEFELTSCGLYVRYQHPLSTQMMDESSEVLLQFPPLREMCVSACGFPEDATEMDVRAYFSTFGNITQVATISEREKSCEDEDEMDIDAQVLSLNFKRKWLNNSLENLHDPVWHHNLRNSMSFGWTQVWKLAPCRRLLPVCFRLCIFQPSNRVDVSLNSGIYLISMTPRNMHRHRATRPTRSFALLLHQRHRRSWSKLLPRSTPQSSK